MKGRKKRRMWRKKKEASLLQSEGKRKETTDTRFRKKGEGWGGRRWGELRTKPTLHDGFTLSFLEIVSYTGKKWYKRPPLYYVLIKLCTLEKRLLD